VLHDVKNTGLRTQQIWLAVGSLMIIAAVALATALIYTRDVMIPFVLAIFITAAVAPMVDVQIRRWNLPSWFAVLTTIFVVLAALAALGLVLVLAVQAMIRAATEYSDQVVHLTNDMLTRLKEHDIQVDPGRITKELEGRLPGIITQTAGTVTALLSHGVLVMFFVIFLLVGRRPRHRQASIYTEIEVAIRRYINTITGLGALTAIVVGCVLWMLGLHMAWLFAFLVFLLNYIPNIGSIIATLLPLPVAITQFHNPWMVLIAVALPGLIQTAIGNIMAPRMMGRGLELHPVTVLLSLAFWGLLWGIVGMVLAVPIVASLRIVMSRFSTTQPIANLLAGHLPGAEVAATTPSHVA
jgi:AI-2 transport protein TqsA